MIQGGGGDTNTTNIDFDRNIWGIPESRWNGTCVLPDPKRPVFGG